MVFKLYSAYMNNTLYTDRRVSFEDKFKSCIKIESETTENLSPNGLYKLVIEVYQNKKGGSYSKGIVINLKNNATIAEILRNYELFWFQWVTHRNGCKYLLCGEDYQGYMVINLTHEDKNIYFPEEGYEGGGFCWTDVFVSNDSSLIAVDGCYWGCPYELVVYDFSQPDVLPYKEVTRIDSLHECLGWNENNELIVKRIIEVRKSDKKPYNQLTEKEQKILDDDLSLIESIDEQLIIKKPIEGYKNTLIY